MITVVKRMDPMSFLPQTRIANAKNTVDTAKF